MSTESGMILVGVGGGGCQFAAAARRAFGERLHAVGLDTDRQAVNSAEGLRGLVLGAPRLDGLGAGGDPVKGRLAMQDDAETFAHEWDGVHIAVVVVALGGGTGGGATPELLRLLRKKEITTLCFALMPFPFEDAARRQAADRALPQLDENADTVVVISQSDLWADDGGGEQTFIDARREACRTFGHAVSLLWRLVLTPGFIRFDPARLRAVLASRGRARFCLSEAIGATRARDAATGLLAQVGSADAAAPARAVVLGILAGEDLRLSEVGEIMHQVGGSLPPDCRLDMGTIVDAGYDGCLCVIALVFETWRETGAGTGGAAPDGRHEARPTLSGGARRGRAAGGSKSKLGFNTGKGRFRDIESTIFNGEDLDIPTVVRKHIPF
jgi:cell division protein FtsZ